MRNNEILDAWMARRGPQLLEYGRPDSVYTETKPVPVKSAAGLTREEWLCIVAIVGILAAILLPSRGVGRRVSPQLVCEMNLRNIAMAVAQYSKDHHGVFPDSLSQLTPKYSDPRSIACAVGRSGSSAAGMSIPYVYCGRGLDPASNPASVLIYEHPSAHQNRPLVNVAYIDGSLRQLPRAEALYVMKELQAGYNPPRPEKLRQNPAATSGVAIESLDDQGQRRSNRTP